MKIVPKQQTTQYFRTQRDDIRRIPFEFFSTYLLKRYPKTQRDT